MRREIDDRRLSPEALLKLLLDLREVPVLRHAVGAHALVALGEEVVGLRVAPRAAHAAHAVDDDARAA